MRNFTEICEQLEDIKQIQDHYHEQGIDEAVNYWEGYITALNWVLNNFKD